MALTLGDLRTFCQDVASPDSVGDKSERDFMVAINSALARIYTGFQWDEIDHVQKITVPPSESGSELVTTQGSLSISLGGAETFLSKYVDDEWALLVDSEDRFNFELASIDDSPTNQNATLKAGDEWIKASGSSLSYSFVKHKHDLPNNATRVVRIEALRNGFPIDMVSPETFDHYRAGDPNQTGSWPRVACFRNRKVEIWPVPGNEYMKLEVTYRKGPPQYTTNDADSTELEWNDVHKDLVYKALQLEFSLIDGEAARLPLGQAAASWEECLGRYKALDSAKAKLTGPMNVSIPSRRPYVPHSFSGGPAVDNA